MLLVILIDILVLAALVYVKSRRGFEATLPLAAFFLITFPEESKISLFGLFDVTTQRFVTLLLISLSFGSRNQPGTLARHMPLSLWIGAIAFWWTLATLNSIAFVDSLKALFSLILDYFAIYVLYVRHLSKVQTLRSIFFAVACGLIVCSVFGTIEAYGNWSVVSMFPAESHRFGSSGGLYLDDARGLRVQSTFGHPILFGSALAMGIPMTLYLLATSKSRMQSRILWIGLLFMFTSIFKTSSRGPWLALAGSLVPFLFFGRRQIRKYIVIISILAVTVVIIRPGVWKTIWDDYVSTVDNHSSQGESYVYRYELYRLVIDKLDESPAHAIWGYGPQSFPYLHLSGTINGRGMEFVSCDSSIAALLVETGYMGLALMGTMFLYVLIFTIRTASRSSHANGQLCILFFVNLLAFYFEMTNVAILGWGQQTVLLWVIIAMIMSYPRLLRHSQRESSSDVSDTEEVALVFEPLAGQRNSARLSLP